ncbi:hypothetical protein JHW45_16300 [Paracoccus stylophorae]|uniref:Uncharacterized protein n=1 Tax=Paracoccus stylophorae TaxID=659350 RepID=A0ABY7SUN4_9RHOB|nr:hypothetical protein [Paracoccus stylophorae]WCR10584.1 hypothetical protein JHW45_16300 [Paracoccus stylophorae]
MTKRATKDEGAMRADLMEWTQRLVAAVFLVGLVALIAAVVRLATQSDVVPPLPIYAGVLGLVTLLLLAGACMALISIAISARKGAEALRRLAAQGASVDRLPATPVPFSSTRLRQVAQAQPEPAPPASPPPNPLPHPPDPAPGRPQSGRRTLRRAPPLQNGHTASSLSPIAVRSASGRLRSCR